MKIRLNPTPAEGTVLRTWYLLHGCNSPFTKPDSKCYLRVLAFVAGHYPDVVVDEVRVEVISRFVNSTAMPRISTSSHAKRQSTPTLTPRQVRIPKQVGLTKEAFMQMLSNDRKGVTP